MRVIAGKAKRIPLQSLEGIETRPTTDRIKETLFNMIAPYLYDAKFLDLFSGCGGIGIEALSRGVRKAVFVEKNPKAMECIKENLKKTNLSEGAELYMSDVMVALKMLEGKTFDYIFMDPPYNQQIEKDVLEYIAGADLLGEDGIIIVEASKETDFEYLEEWGFTLLKEKVYKTNKHLFIELNRGEKVC